MFHKLSVKMPQSVHKCSSDDPGRCLKEKMVECGREGGIAGTMQLNLLENGGVVTIEETGIQN